jgi:hypothetical protein
MKKLLSQTLLSVTCLLLACHTVRAGDSTSNSAAANAAPVVEIKPDTAAGYTPKTKSVFSASANEHNPFWPIGWVKMENESASDSSAPLIPHAEDFIVTTILLNDPPMAVINGKDMAEGEVAALPISGQNVVVQLMAVQDGRVVLRWQNQNIVVPIHRDEILAEPSTALR